MLFEENTKLVIIGDSVTDCERAKPYGEGLFGAIGKGYAGIVSGLLEATYPDKKIRTINMGNGGNTVRDLKERWETDVIELKPDWVSIMIGVNDVWRQYDSPRITEKHVYLEEYKETLEFLVKRTLPVVKGMILMTPFYMEPNREDSMRDSIHQYGEEVKKIAEKYGTVLVDTQAAFDELLKHCHSASIGWDRVHPNLTGHILIARTFLNAVGYDWKG